MPTPEARHQRAIARGWEVFQLHAPLYAAGGHRMRHAVELSNDLVYHSGYEDRGAELDDEAAKRTEGRGFWRAVLDDHGPVMRGILAMATAATGSAALTSAASAPLVVGLAWVGSVIGVVVLVVYAMLSRGRQ